MEWCELAIHFQLLLVPEHHASQFRSGPWLLGAILEIGTTSRTCQLAGQEESSGLLIHGPEKRCLACGLLGHIQGILEQGILSGQWAYSDFTQCMGLLWSLEQALWAYSVEILSWVVQGHSALR